MFDAVFVFGDGFNRARFFAGDGYVHDGMIGTTGVTLSAAYAGFVINTCLSVFKKYNGVFRAVHVAASGYTSAA